MKKSKNSLEININSDSNSTTKNQSLPSSPTRNTTKFNNNINNNSQNLVYRNKSSPTTKEDSDLLSDEAHIPSVNSPLMSPSSADSASYFVHPTTSTPFSYPTQIDHHPSHNDGDSSKCSPSSDISSSSPFSALEAQKNLKNHHHIHPSSHPNQRRHGKPNHKLNIKESTKRNHYHRNIHSSDEDSEDIFKNDDQHLLILENVDILNEEEEEENPFNGHERNNISLASKDSKYSKLHEFKESTRESLLGGKRRGKANRGGKTNIISSSQPQPQSPSSSSFLPFPNLSRRKKSTLTWERKIEVMPELEFLKLIQNENDPSDIENWIQRRILFLNENDDAEKMAKMPYWKLAFYRCPAIILTLTLEMVVGFVISRYNNLMEHHILLTSFMPVLSSVSGNIGLQASTATLRALATGHAAHDSLKDVLKLMVKELASATIIATLTAIVLSIVSGVWSNSSKFAITTGLSILMSAAISGVIGCLSPVVFKNLSLDPAVTAGPFETAIQDIIGISMYLSLALLIL